MFLFLLRLKIMEVKELEQFVFLLLLSLMNVDYHFYSESNENFLWNLTNLVKHVSIIICSYFKV